MIATVSSPAIHLPRGLSCIPSDMRDFAANAAFEHIIPFMHPARLVVEIFDMITFLAATLAE